MIPISYCGRYTCDYVWSTVVVTYIPRILLIKSWKVKVQSIWEFKKRWCSHTQHSSPQRNNNLVFTDDISITGGSIILWHCILCPLFTSKTVSNMIQWFTSDGIFNQFLGLMMQSQVHYEYHFCSWWVIHKYRTVTDSHCIQIKI